jgi:hypothetical protein
MIKSRFQLFILIVFLGCQKTKKNNNVAVVNIDSIPVEQIVAKKVKLEGKYQ